MYILLPYISGISKKLMLRFSYNLQHWSYIAQNTINLKKSALYHKPLHDIYRKLPLHDFYHKLPLNNLYYKWPLLYITSTTKMTSTTNFLYMTSTTNYLYMTFTFDHYWPLQIWPLHDLNSSYNLQKFVWIKERFSPIIWY